MLIVRGILPLDKPITAVFIVIMESSRFAHVYLQPLVGSTTVSTSHTVSLTPLESKEARPGV